MSPHSGNRRRFRRIGFDARTELSQGNQRWPVKLIDLSLKGLLVECPVVWVGDRAKMFSVDIHLAPHTDIRMDIQLAHEERGQLGFVCRYISLESISTLRRLIELNLGDPKALDRELGALIQT